MALTKVSRGLLTTSIVDNGNATAITIDSSENVTFAGTLSLPNANATNEISFTGTEFTNVLSATTSGFQFGTTGAGYLALLTNNAEAMRIDSSGNVGIGTSSPSNLLHLHNTAGDSFIRMSGGGSLGVNYGGFVRGYGVAGTGGYLDIGVIDANSFRTAIQVRQQAAEIIFKNGDTERMRLSGGNLLVGTTSSSLTNANGIQLLPASGGANKPRINIATAGYTGGDFPLSIYSTAVGAWRFYVNAAGTIHAVSTTITSLSDERVKENIRDLDDGLSKVMQLQPRKFDWKEGKGKNITNDRGFIAQEFEQVFPDLVDEWKDEAPEGEEPYKAVSADLIPTLVKAIQEQQATIEALTQRIQTLENN
jgi:hypothetical protein